MPVLTLLYPFYPLRGFTCGMVLPTIRVGLPSSAKPVWKCIQRYPIAGSPRIFQFSQAGIELIISLISPLDSHVCFSKIDTKLWKEPYRSQITPGDDL